MSVLQLQSDILILGATGFTGRLITRYLAGHPQRSQFSISIGARSTQKLTTLVKELGLGSDVRLVQVDVTKYEEVERAVKNVKVVINTVGPYWRWGTPVVRACVRNGIHYVDLTGETVWIKDIILEFDYMATKTGAIIVPSCGMDSIPSDISAFLSNQTLKSQPHTRLLDIRSSTTAHRVRGGISGGTLSTMMVILEEVPKDKTKAASGDYSLSPLRGSPSPPFQFLYKLPIPGMKTIIGAFFFMQPTNKHLVQRTWGLLEYQALPQIANAEVATSERTEAIAKERYGPNFNYDEFIVMPSTSQALIFITGFLVSVGLLVFVPPVKWLVKRWIPQPGEGPTEEVMQNGFIQSTNLTIATDPKSNSEPVYVKSILKGHGDPGYLLSSIMISESALCLLPLSSRTSPSSTSTSTPTSNSPYPLPAALPGLAHKGGVLTPMSAFGDVLVQRLRATGRFEFESEVVSGAGVVAATEERKNV